jgi:arylsulfate sulfotransferase
MAPAVERPVFGASYCVRASHRLQASHCLQASPRNQLVAFSEQCLRVSFFFQVLMFVAMMQSCRCLLLMLLAILPCLGCRDSLRFVQQDHSTLAASLFIKPPTIRSNPIERVPLVAIIEFQTSEDVEPILEIDDGDRRWQQLASSRILQREHRIAVLGMRPARQHSIRVVIKTAAGNNEEISEVMHFTTPALPADFPPLNVIASKPEEMEPGVTMFAVNLWENDLSILDYGYIVALDEQGEVVWYCKTQDRIADLRRLKNGNLLYQHGSYRFLYEIDLLGRDVRCWYGSNLTMPPNPHATAVEVDTMHHEILELANGNFLTLATELRHFEQFPKNEFDAKTAFEAAEVVCDDVVEFRPDGSIVERFHLTDVLDSKVFGYLSTGRFWKDKYDERIGAQSRDWSHANGLIYLPEEHAIIVSFRHLDCLMKIDWQTKQTRWILGDSTGWAAAWQPYFLQRLGDMPWSYHQHGPQLTSRGTILMYDNGNYRTRPFGDITPANKNRSRIVEVAIDESEMTVEQVYAYSGDASNPFYCPFYGEADLLPVTNNILITDGGHIELDDGTPSDDVPAERQWARIFELSRDESPEIVFEVKCESPLGSDLGWSIYRANRYPNLQDGFNVDPPSVDEPIQVFERGRIVKVP